MSGSRAILLKLSVNDADVVLNTLRNVGTQGEAALAKLDAAAQRAANTVGGTSGGGTGTMRGALQSAGYQVQDFAVQIQGGTSALTALSQQGSQFLGVFGPGGAVAGAILTVGILASRFLDLGSASEAAAEAQKKHTEAIEASRLVYETATERAERLAAANTAVALAAVQASITTDRLSLAAENARAPNERLLGAAERAATGGGPEPASEAARIRAIEDDARTRVMIINERLTEAMTERDQLRLLLQFGRPNGDQYGPPSPSAADLRARDERPTVGNRVGDAEHLQDTLVRLRAQVDEQATRERRRFDDMVASVDPATQALRRYEEQQRQIQEAVQHGIATEEEARVAIDATTAAYQRNLTQIDERARRADRMGKDLGNTLSTAFESAIIKGSKLSDVLKQVANDLARIVLRNAVTEPLGSALSAAAKPLASSIGGLFGFADGGVMTSAGPLPLRRYATGGIANTPQIAMFGEGRTPEAYVPLPDGRSIPVKMQGEAPSITINNNIDARGADASMLPRLRMEMQAISQATVAQLMDRLGRGTPLRARLA